MKYETTHLWNTFKTACPILHRIPILGTWAFGVFVRAYFDVKQP